MSETISGIIERMRLTAPPGQSSLSAQALPRLRALTRELIAARPEAAAEHTRFLQIARRALCLPERELGARLGGATVLVTGGTGCVGSTLLAQLAARCTGRLVSVSRGVTSGWPRHPDVDYLHADIRDRPALDALIGEVRPDVIFHLAAQRDPGLAESDAHAAITTNVFGTRNVLDAAARAGVPQVVCASTGKALRPYSPDVYTAAKRAAEWLMAEAAASGALRCSAARFTHVVDNSIVYQRLRTWAAAGQPGRTKDAAADQVIRLHSPDIAFYAQSARESAQLLLAAYLGAADGELRLCAITDLGLPVSLLDLAVGVLAETGSDTPVYLCGYDAGYEQASFPALYDPLTAGDVSPLLNAFEAADLTESPASMADAFRLAFAADQRLPKQLRALEDDCARTRDPAVLRESLSDLSWPLLDAALAVAAPRALRRAACLTGRHAATMPPVHQRMLTAIRAQLPVSG
jgi:nucleoside-diphosphate-sugar epimerase